MKDQIRIHTSGLQENLTYKKVGEDTTNTSCYENRQVVLVVEINDSIPETHGSQNLNNSGVFLGTLSWIRYILNLLVEVGDDIADNGLGHVLGEDLLDIVLGALTNLVKSLVNVLKPDGRYRISGITGQVGNGGLLKTSEDRHIVPVHQSQ